jgi:hypothetical protein
MMSLSAPARRRPLGDPLLIVTVGPERELDEPDELGRTRTGYRDGISDRELYRAARGSWVLGEKADNELFALVAHGGIVRLAIESGST